MNSALSPVRDSAGLDLPAIDEGAFRRAMAHVAAPVTVVTTMNQGRPHGTTVSAFFSLSLNPPMVLAALDERSDLLQLARRTRRVGVNVLAEDQAELALNFSRKGPDKFADVRWRSESRLPRLEGALAWLACRVSRIIQTGDHRVLLAVVEDVDVAVGAPLVYHQRRFGTHSPTPNGSGPHA